MAETTTMQTPMGPVTICQHKDGMGETADFHKCGCRVTRRGNRYRRRYCERHERFRAPQEGGDHE